MDAWRRFWRGFGYAFRGIGATLAAERNMKVHAALAFVALGTAIWLDIPRDEIAVLVLCIGLVIGMELMNTAIEKAVDLAMPDRHPLARFAKDAAAGAVLVGAIASLAVGLLILLPPLVAKLKGGMG